jgi:hypothetical protein
MMDGVRQENNVSDNALDAWNAHVLDVEQVADSITDGGQND